MELEKAKEIVRLLADGIDPTTGEVLPKESPYNDPVIIRALFSVLESLKEVRKPKKTIEQKQQENIDSGRPRNAGLPWTDELKTEVASKFQSGTSVPELSRHLERTKGAIVSELMRQGLIESDEESDDS
jgi:DNA-binding transcriptional ArsR family regulator